MMVIKNDCFITVITKAVLRTFLNYFNTKEYRKNLYKASIQHNNLKRQFSFDYAQALAFYQNDC